MPEFNERSTIECHCNDARNHPISTKDPSRWNEKPINRIRSGVAVDAFDKGRHTIMTSQKTQLHLILPLVHPIQTN